MEEPKPESAASIAFKQFLSKYKDPSAPDPFAATEKLYTAQIKQMIAEKQWV